MRAGPNNTLNRSPRAPLLGTRAAARCGARLTWALGGAVTSRAESVRIERKERSRSWAYPADDGDAMIRLLWFFVLGLTLTGGHVGSAHAQEKVTRDTNQ